MPAVKFGFFADPDRTRYCYLRLRRLKKAIAETNMLDALAAELEVAVEPSPSPRDKMAAIERQIDRLRATGSSIWHQAPAPDVLAATLFAASKQAADGPLGELFSRASNAAALAPPVETWLDSAGLTLFDRLPPGRRLRPRRLSQSRLFRVARRRHQHQERRKPGRRCVGIDEALRALHPIDAAGADTRDRGAVLPKTRAIDGESLTALMAAFGART